MQLAKSSSVDESLQLQVTTYPLRHRGDTLRGMITPMAEELREADCLSGPVLNVTLSSPLEGVVGVTIEHFAVSEH